MKCDELKAEYVDDLVIKFQDYGYPMAYLKDDVDEAIAELKAKLESVQASAYAESVDAGMENRKRAKTP